MVVLLLAGVISIGLGWADHVLAEQTELIEKASVKA